MKGPPRFVHTLVVILLFLATLLGTLLVVVSMRMSNFIAWEPKASDASFIAPMVIIACSLLFAILAIVRRLAWRWVAVSSLVPVALLVFIIHDEPRPKIPELGLRTATDDPGYRTLMWLGKTSPYSRLNEISEADPESVHLPKEPDQWAGYVRTNRQAIEQAWDALVLPRTWMENLARQPPHGIWSIKNGEPILAFKPIRRLSHVINARAYLHAVEGDPEKPADELITLIQSINQIQQHGPGLLHQAIAAVVLKESYQTIDEILARTTPPPATVNSLRSTLRTAPSIGQQFRNTFGGEIEFGESVISDAWTNRTGADDFQKKQSRLLVLSQRFGGPFVLNHNQTVRLISDSMLELERLAAARKTEELKHWSPVWTGWDLTFKNPVGRLLAAQFMPTYDKVVSQLWANEDQRLALLQRLGPEATN